MTWAGEPSPKDEHVVCAPCGPAPSRPPCTALPCAARSTHQAVLHRRRLRASPSGQDSGHLADSPLTVNPKTEPPPPPLHFPHSIESLMQGIGGNLEHQNHRQPWMWKMWRRAERASAGGSRAGAPCTEARGSRTAAGVGLKRQTSGVGVHESAPGPGVHRIFFPRRCGSRAAHTQQATREPRETTERRIDEPRRVSSPGTCRPGSS